MYVRTYIYHIHVYIHTYIHTHLYICIYVCMCVYMCIFRKNNIIPLALPPFWGRPVHLCVICINKSINTVSRRAILLRCRSFPIFFLYLSHFCSSLSFSLPPTPLSLYTCALTYTYIRTHIHTHACSLCFLFLSLSLSGINNVHASKIYYAVCV